MRARVVVLVASVLALLGGPAGAAAASAGPGAPARAAGQQADAPAQPATEDAADRRDRVADARRRWEQMSGEERALLRERFAQLQELAPEEREALASVARRVKALEAQVDAALPAPLRDELAELPDPERRGVVREHVRDALLREGADVRARLPESLIERIAAETPLQRPAALHALLRRTGPLGVRDARRLGTALGLDEREIEQLDALESPALEDRVLTLHREGIDRAIEELGLPPGLDAAGYARMRALPHTAFFRRWRALDPPEAYATPPARRMRRAPPSAEARRDALLCRQALHLLAPTLEDRIALARTPKPEREAALGLRIRARVLGFLEEHRLVDGAELEALRAAEGSGFPRLGRRILEARRKALID